MAWEVAFDLRADESLRLTVCTGDGGCILLVLQADVLSTKKTTNKASTLLASVFRPRP